LHKGAFSPLEKSDEKRGEISDARKVNKSDENSSLFSPLYHYFHLFFHHSLFSPLFSSGEKEP
jgi:hypothetical protein